MSVNSVEALWLLICGAGILVTTGLLIDAIAERHAYIQSGANGRVRARRLVLDGTVRRDSLRLLAQAMLLIFALPQLFRDGETPLNVTVVSLMLVPVVLLASSLFDARDRRRLHVISEHIVISEREQKDADLMNAIHEVGEKADAAYVEANSVNEKLGKLNERLIEQGNVVVDEMKRTDRHQEKQDERIEAVEEAAT